MVRRADMARGTCGDATRHARPRGRAARAHAVRKWSTGGTNAWQGASESTRTPEGEPHGDKGLAFEGPMG